MTKYIERLMSRASVAAMAAHAKEPVSTVPAFAERVEDTPPAPGGGERPDPVDGLSAEEQAQFEAMNAEQGPDDAGNVDPTGDAPGDGDPPADGDGDDDGDPPADAAADRDVPADGAERREPRTINYKRHQKELAKAQKEREELQAKLDAAQGETRKEREERLVLNERTRMLLEAIQTKQAPAAAPAPKVDEDPEPDLDADPVGHALWGNRQLRRELEEIKSGRQQEQQQTAAQQEENAIWTALDQDIGRAIAADPSFTDAFAHLRETRFQELGFIYANIDITDPAQCQTLTRDEQAALSENIQRTFRNEQLMVASQAIKSRKSPAQTIANLARARGWKPGAAPAATPPAVAPAAAAAPVVPAAPPRAPAARPSVKDQLAAVRDNLDASRSLSDGGGSPGDNMSPERLAAMSPAEFERYYESIPKDILDGLMGKPANM